MPSSPALGSFALPAASQALDYSKHNAARMLVLRPTPSPSRVSAFRAAGRRELHGVRAPARHRPGRRLRSGAAGAARRRDHLPAGRRAGAPQPSRVRKGGRVICAGIHMSDMRRLRPGCSGRSARSCPSPILRGRTAQTSFASCLTRSPSPRHDLSACGAPMRRFARLSPEWRGGAGATAQLALTGVTGRWPTIAHRNLRGTMCACKRHAACPACVTRACNSTASDRAETMTSQEQRATATRDSGGRKHNKAGAERAASAMTFSFARHQAT